MKKIIVILMMLFMIASIFAHSDVMQPIKKSANLDETKIIVPSRQRDQVLPPAPSYNFGINPVDLGGTIYDYMPGSYTGLPILTQPEGVSTGTYIAYHARQNGTSNRKVYYSYVDANGNLISGGAISSDDLWEGFAGMGMDEETGDPIVAYHVDADGDGKLDDNMSFDAYHLASFPGLWVNPPYTVINNTQLANQGIIGADDEFIWPYVQIGTSPEDGKRRVYITSNNATAATGDVASPSENALLAYADVSTDDFTNQVPDSWDWHYRTIAQMDAWHNEDPEWARPYKTFVVHNNYVVYIGELAYDPNTSTTTPKLFALVNDNYGEGDFVYYEFDYQNEWTISDVQNQNASWLYGDTQEAQLRWSMFASEHLNAIFTSDNTISFPGALVIEFLDPDDGKWYYRPGNGHIYVKEFTFDIDNGEFGVIDVYPVDTLETENNTPIVPWDLNGDGEVDGYDSEGYPEWIPSIPIFDTDMSKSFENGTIKITQSKDHLYEAIVWSDCYEAYLQSQGVEGYDDWAETPKVMVALKGNDVDIWRTPIVMNAKDDDDNYVSQFNGMIPVYAYPGGNVTYNDDYIKLNLFFLNDDSYGSSVSGEGPVPDPNLCRLEYASLNITRNEVETHSDNIASLNLINSVNYPNPFNPVTTIRYNIPKNGNVTVKVYNILGQKVKTLVNRVQKSGENSVVWNGTNDNGNMVASGIYMYKIKNGRHTSTKKMILMK